jgi:hypothetical protein
MDERVSTMSMDVMATSLLSTPNQRKKSRTALQSIPVNVKGAAPCAHFNLALTPAASCSNDKEIEIHGISGGTAAPAPSLVHVTKAPDPAPTLPVRCHLPFISCIRLFFLYFSAQRSPTSFECLCTCERSRAHHSV